MGISAAETGIHLGNIVLTVHLENIYVNNTTKSYCFNEIFYQAKQLPVLDRHRFVRLSGAHLDFFLYKYGGYLAGNHINIDIRAVFRTIHKFLYHHIIIQPA